MLEGNDKFAKKSQTTAAVANQADNTATVNPKILQTANHPVAASEEMHIVPNKAVVDNNKKSAHQSIDGKKYYKLGDHDTKIIEKILSENHVLGIKLDGNLNDKEKQLAENFCNGQIETDKNGAITAISGSALIKLQQLGLNATVSVEELKYYIPPQGKKDERSLTMGKP